MPRRPENSSRTRPRLRALHALLLGGVTISVAFPLQGLAQEIGELRGSLSVDGAVHSPEPPENAAAARSGAEAGRSKQQASPRKPDQSAADEVEKIEPPNKNQPSGKAAADEENAGTDAMPTGTVNSEPAASAFPESIIPVETALPAADDFVDDTAASGELDPATPLPVIPPPMSDPSPDQAARDTDAAKRNAAIEQDAAPADDIPAGNIPASPVGSAAEDPVDPAAQREPAIEALNRPVEENPYAAVGLRWGTFILKPSLDTGITATSNADSSIDGSSAVLSETTLRLNAVSDWSSHRATIDAFGTFRKTLSGQEVEDVEGGIDAELLLDLGHEYRARGTFFYSAAPESAASPVVIANAVEEPITQQFGGTLGLEKDAGKARFAITGGIGHDGYGDADLEGGGVLSQKDRDATLYTLALRTGYELSPALTPFVETEIGRNDHDEEVDSAGYRRSSDRWAVRAGLAFDRGEKFSGEIAAGVVREAFDDDRLQPLTAPSLRADILWSPLRGTDVRLTGATILEGTTTPGESGSVLYSSGLSIERQMRANLTGNLALGAAWRDYSSTDGEDTILNAEASLTWWLNRHAGLTGRLRHETVSSNLSDPDTETNSVFLGLKLQR